MKKWNKEIYYSQCWEDPEVLIRALDPQMKDSVLSVTAAGCNTLALALQGVKSIVALDVNPAQNYLLELKIAAITQLEYDAFLKFVGVRQSNERSTMYQQIRPFLSVAASEWWDAHPDHIALGVIHSGKFEKYLALFRQHVLPLVHSRRKIEKLFSFTDLSAQQTFYAEEWDTWRWRVLFKIFFSKTVMSSLGRNSAMFAHAGITHVGEHYLKKTKRALTSALAKNNFFLEYILFGTYRSLDSMPPYMLKKNFESLKKVSDIITIHTGDIATYATSVPENSFSKCNLSDIFEAQSEEEFKIVCGELLRLTKDEGRMAYWNNLVSRKIHEHVSGITEEVSIEEELRKTDRVFFYNQFYVNRVSKIAS